MHLILLDTGLAAGRLELEITEGVIFDEPARALSTLRRLKALGVKISMDDFGTGYASMSSLQSFPFDKIKIDQSFISGVETNPQSAAIVRSIIGLGNSLGIIAEGVETEGERAFLRREGCREIQGFPDRAPGPHPDLRRADQRLQGPPVPSKSRLTCPNAARSRRTSCDACCALRVARAH